MGKKSELRSPSPQEPPTSEESPPPYAQAIFNRAAPVDVEAGHVQESQIRAIYRYKVILVTWAVMEYIFTLYALIAMTELITIVAKANRDGEAEGLAAIGFAFLLVSLLQGWLLLALCKEHLCSLKFFRVLGALGIIFYCMQLVADTATQPHPRIGPVLMGTLNIMRAVVTTVLLHKMIGCLQQKPS